MTTNRTPPTPNLAGACGRVKSGGVSLTGSEAGYPAGIREQREGEKVDSALRMLPSLLILNEIGSGYHRNRLARGCTLHRVCYVHDHMHTCKPHCTWQHHWTACGQVCVVAVSGWIQTNQCSVSTVPWGNHQGFPHPISHIGTHTWSSPPLCARQCMTDYHSVRTH